MNIALEQTSEYVDGVKKNEYGDAFIRGNNGESTRCFPFDSIQIELCHQFGKNSRASSRDLGETRRKLEGKIREYQLQASTSLLRRLLCSSRSKAL